MFEPKQSAYLKRLDVPARFKHFCNPGDLIAALPAMKTYYNETGRKVIVSQQLNVEAQYYPGATHGTTDHTGKMVCMNQAIFDMIKPLITSQEYIADMEEYTGQEVDVDIDVIRKKVFVNLPHGQIQAWTFYAFFDLAYDLSKPWIHLPETDHPIIESVKDKIILNFTERYRNGHINYHFLRKYIHRLIFAGTEREHLLFCNKWKLDIPHLKIANFLELAYAIKNCSFLLSNQSMCWNLAEAMKTPRILELCEYAANCQPFIGEKSYGFYHQGGVEHYFYTLL